MASHSTRVWKLRLALVAIGTVLAVVLAELGLLVLDQGLDVSAARPARVSWWAFRSNAPELSPYHVGDERRGLRHVPDPRHNTQGFRDSDDFAQTPKARHRVLVLGDSFTMGASAIYHGADGYIDLAERELNQRLPGGVVLWNTAMGGTALPDQLLHLERFAPALQPTLVFLAWYENDFLESFFPPAPYYVFADGGWALKYSVVDGDPVALTAKDAWWRAKGYPAKARSPWCVSRFVSVLARRGSCAAPKLARPTRAQLEQVSRERLTELKAKTAALAAPLVVAVIPSTRTMAGTKTPPYLSILRILGDLEIETWDTIDSLVPEDYNPSPDFHWNVAGHRKMGAWLAEKLARRLEGKGSAGPQ